MRVNPAPFRMAQIAITGICIALSIATLGTSAHTLDEYNKGRHTDPWWLYLWPEHFDVHGTKALVGASASTLILSIVFIIVATVPRLTLTPTMHALLGLGTTLPATLVTFVTVIYVHILNSNAPELDTIQTWTCSYKNAERIPEAGNNNFKSLCTESRFALYGTLTLFLLLGISMCLTIMTWLADKFAARSQRKEVEMAAQPPQSPRYT